MRPSETLLGKLAEISFGFSKAVGNFFKNQAECFP